MIRRYAPLSPSRGTVIPRDIRVLVVTRDRGCVGPRVGMPGACFGALELDHVRGSGALGRKSPSTEDNLIALCSTHHRTKTEAGRTWRPVLMEYLEIPLRERMPDGGRGKGLRPRGQSRSLPVRLASLVPVVWRLRILLRRRAAPMGLNRSGGRRGRGEEPRPDHEHYWTDAPDDETGWHCTICGLTEYPHADVLSGDETPYPQTRHSRECWEQWQAAQFDPESGDPGCICNPPDARLWCGQCGDWLRDSDVEGHLNSEGRTVRSSASPPPPDLDPWRLADAFNAVRGKREFMYGDEAANIARGYAALAKTPGEPE